MAFRASTSRAAGSVPPAARCSHTATAVGEELWVIGGGVYIAERAAFEHFADVHVLGADGVWVRISTGGGPFTARRGHSASLYGRHIAVFGGVGNGGELCDGFVWLLDTQCLPKDGHRTAMWTRRRPSSAAEMPGYPHVRPFRVGFRENGARPRDAPPQLLALLAQPELRRGHGSFVVDDELFVFGGYTNSQLHLEGWIYALDLNDDAAAWRLQKTRGADPGACALFASEQTSRFWICAGGTQTSRVHPSHLSKLHALVEIWLLDLRTFVWSRARPGAGGSPPPAARFCCAVATLAEHWVVVPELAAAAEESGAATPRRGGGATSTPPTGLLELLQPYAGGDAGGDAGGTLPPVPCSASATSSLFISTSNIPSAEGAGSAGRVAPVPRFAAASPLSFRRLPDQGVREIRVRLALLLFGGSPCFTQNQDERVSAQQPAQDASDAFYELHVTCLLSPAPAPAPATGPGRTAESTGGGLLDLDGAWSACTAAAPPLLKRQELHHGMLLQGPPLVVWQRVANPPLRAKGAAAAARPPCASFDAGCAWVSDERPFEVGMRFLMPGASAFVPQESIVDGVGDGLCDDVGGGSNRMLLRDPRVLRPSPGREQCHPPAGEYVVATVHGVAPPGATAVDRDQQCDIWLPPPPQEVPTDDFDFGDNLTTKRGRRCTVLQRDVIEAHQRACARLGVDGPLRFGREWARVQPRSALLVHGEAGGNRVSPPMSRNAASLTQLAPPSRTVTVVDVAATRSGAALGGSRGDARHRAARTDFWTRASDAGTLILFGGGVHGVVGIVSTRTKMTVSLRANPSHTIALAPPHFFRPPTGVLS